MSPEKLKKKVKKLKKRGSGKKPGTGSRKKVDREWREAELIASLRKRLSLSKRSNRELTDLRRSEVNEANRMLDLFVKRCQRLEGEIKEMETFRFSARFYRRKLEELSDLDYQEELTRDWDLHQLRQHRKDFPSLYEDEETDGEINEESGKAPGETTDR